MNNVTFLITLDSFQRIAKQSNITVKDFLNLVLWIYTDKLNEASENENFIILTLHNKTLSYKNVFFIWLSFDNS